MPISSKWRSLLPESEWERIERFRDSREPSNASQLFGADTDGAIRAYAIGYWLHRFYFRARTNGQENLPATGSAVLAGNHSGVLPFDAVVMAADVFKHTEPARIIHYMVDYFVYRVPFLGTFFRDMGQLAGTRANFDGAVENGQLVGVFPEGAKALGKQASDRYKLLKFSYGHVELAARHRIPVIPVAIVGAEEQQTMVADIKPLAKALGLPYFPVTTTFPWFGPLGLLPKPVRYYIEYGKPIHIDDTALESAEAAAFEAQRVRAAVEKLIECGQQRRSEELASGSSD